MISYDRHCKCKETKRVISLFKDLGIDGGVYEDEAVWPEIDRYWGCFTSASKQTLETMKEVIENNKKINLISSENVELIVNEKKWEYMFFFNDKKK